jgi:diguanylate cyclase (GGDEF)-like protein/PAS domain S-box-containing protein
VTDGKNQGGTVHTAIPHSRQRRPSVLVVDDEPQVLTAISDTLEGDFQVLTEQSPECAIALLKRQEVSVIISDQRMPELSGHEFLAAARQISDATRILITGFSDLEAVIAAVNDGKIFGYLSKPWDPAVLRVAVLKAAEHHALGRELRDREEMFRQFAENTRHVIWIRSAEAHKDLYVSPAYEQIWGRAPQTLSENIGTWIDSVHSADRARVSHVPETTETFDLEYRIVRPDGSIRWIHDRGFPIRDSQGRVYRFAGIAEDITLRKAHEHRIARLSRIHEVLSGISSAIVRMHDRRALFEEACRIAVEEGGFDLAWVGTFNEETQSVSQIALRGPEADTQLIRIANFTARVDAPEGRGVVGRAIRDRTAVFCNDLDAGSDHPPGVVELIARGYRSVISLPLLTNGTRAGVMVLYSKERDIFDEEEVTLLSELARDISFALEYIRKEEQLNHLAYHDQLTGLSNRVMLRRRLSQAVNRVRDNGNPFALMLMNLNNFRDINDTLGHQNGDILLQQVAKRLNETLWESDVVACLGGDEYAILLPRLADKGDIDIIIDKLTAALRHGFVVSNLPIVIEPRIGYALYPDHGDTAELLWQRADMALRASKEFHQTRLLYHPELDHYDPQRLALIGELQSAIDNDELLLHYQPKIEIATGRTVGVEGLLRWRHPARQMIYPDAFIPLVERTSLINPLTRWVLAKAVRQGRAWQEAGLPLEVSVNLSVRNLQDPDLSAEILEIARGSRFPLDRLTVEITESAIMVDPSRAKAVLAELSDAGIRISMDDFGIGQSSLNYLKDLVLHNMKIDKSFVIGFKRERNAAIVRSAVELGHNLGLTVTAEGIEDEEIFEALANLGCDFGQGYFISKPVPVDEITPWLRSSRWKMGAA